MSRKLDLAGKNFGRLAVLEDVGSNKRGNLLWLCRCDCGIEKVVVGSSLISGQTRSCGCYCKDRASKARRLDLVGKKFGRLFVIKDVGNDKWGHSLFQCLCDCGNEVVVLSNRLLTGNTKSCGCLHKEIVGKPKSLEHRQKMSKNHVDVSGEKNFNYKHGLYRTKGYKNQAAAKRNAEKKNQTSASADLEKIAYIYQVCETMNQTNEEKYEVDHIIPLSKGGLHHQDNLQILLAKLNHKKNAKITNEYKGITLEDLS